MKAEYPNLELIEYKFKEVLSIFKKKYESPDEPWFIDKLSADVFLQTWSNTATGFDKENYVSGQAFTDAYTTVFRATWVKEIEKYQYERVDDVVVYGVFFGNNLAYTVTNPNGHFYNDLEQRDMYSQKYALREYQSHTSERNDIEVY